MAKKPPNTKRCALISLFLVKVRLNVKMHRKCPVYTIHKPVKSHALFLQFSLSFHDRNTFAITITKSQLFVCMEIFDLQFTKYVVWFLHIVLGM